MVTGIIRAAAFRSYLYWEEYGIQIKEIRIQFQPDLEVRFITHDLQLYY
jgi:hypothetical protein